MQVMLEKRALRSLINLYDKELMQFQGTAL